MDILKTFEIFSRESISIIRQRIVKFFLFETNSPTDTDFCIHADIKSSNETQISVFNNEKVYNLLTTTWQRYQKRQNNENIKS